MPKKVLFCATVDYHFKAFHIPYLKWFKEQGWEVHIAANGSIDLPFVDQKFNIPIHRSPIHKNNILAFRQLREIINSNHYSIVHCHTPMGGVLTRLAALELRKKGAKVFYTAHGFHFCKGSSLLSWLAYYPMERVLSRLTDQLITINSEDYQLALSHQFKAKQIDHVFGVGIDTERFKPISNALKHEKKQNLGFQKDDFLIIYTAEFNKNKNQKLLIKVMETINNNFPNVKLLLAGEGALIDSCRSLVSKFDLVDHVRFLGFRNDIAELLPVCDLAVSASFREGLPVNIMEAMACGLPIIATMNRGHSELVKNDTNGWIIENQKIDDMADKIKRLYFEEQLRNSYGKNSRELILQKYSVAHTLKQNTILYQRSMEETGGVNWAVQ